MQSSLLKQYINFLTSLKVSVYFFEDKENQY